MNGNGYRDPDLRSGLPRSSVHGPPPPKVLMDGYNESYERSFEDRAKFNPLNTSRPRSSALLNVSDPVAMHLLTETALGDSQEYEVLSFEEVEQMKKEYSLLANRIQASKRKLALETKVRDAAQSLSRLYSKSERGDDPTSPNRQRRSFLSSKKTGRDSLAKTDEELLNSTRKCEDLAGELWRLEQRATDIQRRLLHHTAGVLQMTHRGIIKGSGGPANSLHQPLPGTPESMHTINGRSSMGGLDDDDEFDDRSLYRTHDRLGEFGGGYKVRGSTADMEDHLTSRNRSGSNSRSRDFSLDSQAVSFAEKKLDELNHRLREMVLHASPDQAQSFGNPPRLNSTPSQQGNILQTQLEYLEECLESVDRAQQETLRNAQETEYATEERLGNLNTHLHAVISAQQGQNHPAPPQLSGQSLQSQISYLESGLETIEREFESGAGSKGDQEKVEQYNVVLTGLWDIILSGEEEARQRKQQKLRSRSAGAANDDSDLSPDEDALGPQEFSLQSFSAKVQKLYTRATGLSEQKNILRRQIKQQRELNKSHTDKQADASKTAAELEEANRALLASEKEAREAREEVILLMQRLSDAKKEMTHREQQRGNEESATLKELRQRESEMQALEATLAEMKDDHGIAKAELHSQLHEYGGKIQALEADLKQAHQAKDANVRGHEESSRLIQEKTQQLEKTQADMAKLESEVVRLQTEVTVARAELDGAYGTRAQRAAEVASNPAVQRELDELTERNATLVSELAALRASNEQAGSGKNALQQRVDTLQRELSETIAEYEVMTKQTIDFEKEREQLETTIDGLRDRCEALEIQLGDEKVKWMGIKSPADGAKDAVQSTSTTVLKNEFKKMMRDTRAENTRALRAEQEERKRLEGLVRTLKKEQSAGKSSLSQSVSAL